MDSNDAADDADDDVGDDGDDDYAWRYVGACVTCARRSC